MCFKCNSLGKRSSGLILYILNMLLFSFGCQLFPPLYLIHSHTYKTESHSNLPLDFALPNLTPEQMLTEDCQDDRRLWFFSPGSFHCWGLLQVLSIMQTKYFCNFYDSLSCSCYNNNGFPMSFTISKTKYMVYMYGYMCERERKREVGRAHDIRLTLIILFTFITFGQCFCMFLLKIKCQSLFS